MRTTIKAGCLLVRAVDRERVSFLRSMPPNPGFRQAIEVRRWIDSVVVEEWLDDYYHARTCACRHAETK